MVAMTDTSTPTPPEQIHAVAMDLSNPARPRIHLDGVDVADGTAGFALTYAENELPELVIYRRRGATVLEGVAVVMQAEVDSASLAAADAIIGSIDVQTLHHEALDSLGFGCGEYDTTQAIVDGIRRRLQEVISP